MKAEYLECGKICAPHGVRGVLKVEPWCDSPSVLARAKAVYLKSTDGYRKLPVLTASVSGAYVLLSVEGISSREKAQAYKNTVLHLHRHCVMSSERCELRELRNLDSPALVITEMKVEYARLIMSEEVEEFENIVLCCEVS